MYQNIPLAEKLRPKTLDEVLGQEHLTGDNGTIRKMLVNDTLNSLILWGPPGTGKTTLAEIISSTSGRKFFKLSAVSSGVKEVREVIEDAKKQNLFTGKSPILFIDEIHRFNKSQQFENQKFRFLRNDKKSHKNYVILNCSHCYNVKI